VALEAGLRPSLELSQTALDGLDKENRQKKAMTAAERLLSFRPRSQREICRKLAQKGFGEDIQGEVLRRLKELGLVDDAAFARYWAENRSAFSPRSSRMLQLELRQKGVIAELAQETSSGVDDAEAAYASGVKKAARLTALDYEDFRRKLGEFLKRRGFGYEVIDRSVKRLWDERDQ
jgi:regulatory protein